MIETKKHERESEERAELAAVLASGIFAKAPNLAKLLSYLCERYWEGEIDSVKEYRLAVEALGRPPDFNPSSNAIVRVEIHRLREKLRKYYENEGSEHKVVIASAGALRPTIYSEGGDPQASNRKSTTSIPDQTEVESYPGGNNNCGAGCCTNRRLAASTTSK